MFEVDGSKFYNAQNAISKAISSLNSKKGLVDAVASAYPPGFEYVGEVQQVSSIISEAIVMVISLSTRIDNLKNELMSEVEGFTSDYLSTSGKYFQGDAFGNQFAINQSQSDPFIKMSNDDYKKYLLDYYEKNEAILTDEQRVQYESLKAERAEQERIRREQREKERKAKEEYDNMSDWGKIWTNTKTTVLSFGEGLVSVGEDAVDGCAMYYGIVRSGFNKLMGDYDQAEEVERQVKDFVSTDYASKAYDWVVDKTGLNTYSAYGDWHTVGEATGTIAGYMGLSYLPGGIWVTTSTSAMAASGDAAQQAFASGADFKDASTASMAAGFFGAASGAGLDYVQSAAAGSRSAGDIFKYSFAGAGVAAAEPLANTAVQYVTYGNDGNISLGGYVDYLNESGGTRDMLMAAVVGGGSTAISGIRGYGASKESNASTRTNNDGNFHSEVPEEFYIGSGAAGGTLIGKSLDATPASSNRIYGNSVDATPASSNRIYGNSVDATPASSNRIYGNSVDATPASSRNLKEDIIKKSETNGQQMKQDILADIPKNLTPEEKARYLYIELNKRVNYDAQYQIKSDKSYRSDKYKKKVDFDSLDGNEVICKGWSELYQDLLISEGFDISNVKIEGPTTNGAHRWVEIDLGNNKKIFADATQAYNHATDLMNCKTGNKTSGFLIVDANENTNCLGKSGMDRISNLASTQDFTYSDNKIGYTTDNKYYGEALEQTKKDFSSLTVRERLKKVAPVDKRIDNLPSIVNDSAKNMGGTEKHSYVQQIRHSYLSDAESKVLYIYNTETKKPNTIFSVKDSQNSTRYFSFDESNNFVETSMVDVLNVIDDKGSGKIMSSGDIL